MYIEKIKYFIDLFECCNYTETAKKNFISQASLSQYINGLEKEFQIKLFDRSVTPVEPTRAGRLFYEEAKILWRQYENMQDIMRSLSTDQLPPLKVGYTSMVDVQSLLPVIPAFKREYPQAEIRLNKILIKDASDFLHRQVCDVSVSFSTEFEADKEVATHTLYEGRFAALVGLSHPLYEKEEIEISELYQYPLIMLSQDTIGNAYDIMQEVTRKDGYIPDIKKTVNDIESELFSIIMDNLIGFAPDNYNLVDFKDHIKMIPIKDSNHAFKIVMAY